MNIYKDEFKAKSDMRIGWHKGGLIHAIDGCEMIAIRDPFQLGNLLFLPAVPETICKKSGVRDDNNNGEMLYTNDIVYVAGKGNLIVEIDPYDGVVFLDKSRTIEETAGDAIMEGDLGKKVGNIFDNPELMED